MTDTETLQRKRRACAGHRGTVTRRFNETAAEVHADTIDTDQLLINKRLLTEKLEVLRVLDGELADLVPEDNLEDEIQTVDEYKAKIYQALAKIEKATATPKVDTNPSISPGTVCDPSLTPTAPRDPPVDPPTDSREPPVDPSTDPRDPPVDPSTDSRDPPVDSPTDPCDPPVDPPTDPRPVDTSTHLTPHHALYTKVKLPKITLPHFKANPIYWTSFWDSYKSAIHANPALSDVDKFNYLRSLLEREAFEAIASLTLSSANYDQAITILKRFGNRQVIVTRHMDMLLSLTAITSDHDVRGMLRLYNEVETNVRSLAALGVKSESYGTMLTSVLLTKLPSEMRLLISRKSPRTELDLNAVLDTLEEELIARERSVGRHHSSHEKPRESHTTPSAMTLHSSSTTASDKPPTRCCYCEQSHMPENCHIVKQIESRKQSLKSSVRCFNCLVQGHVVRRCRSRPQCTCGHKHHPSVCNSASDASPSAEPVQRTSSNVAVSTLNPEAAPYVATTDVSTLQSTTGSSILLQTAKALVYNIRTP